MDRRPIDQERAKWREIRHLRNRRDTLVGNIVRLSRQSDQTGEIAEIIKANRQECQRVNRALMGVTQ